MNVRRRVAIAALVLATPLLSSCGVNFGAQTDQVYNPSVGVDARSGSVDVLNALVVSGTDGAGTVIASLVDNDQVNADSLTGVSGAGDDSSVKVTPGGETAIPAGGLLDLATDGTIFVTGDQVKPGYYVELTFTFERGEPMTVDVPVVSDERPEYSQVKLPPTS